jgi:hypothetical protein
MKSTPWGPSQSAYTLELGVTWVSTAGHGGLMVAAGVAEAKLSIKARACATMLHCGYFCFEEDCDWAVAFYDVPQWSRLMAAKDAREWIPYLGQSVYGLSPAEIQQRFDERAAWARQTDAQTRDRLRLEVLYWNPEYFDLGGCEREGEQGAFGLSCVKRDKMHKDMCDPCRRTQQAVNAARLLEDLQKAVLA